VAEVNDSSRQRAGRKLEVEKEKMKRKNYSQKESPTQRKRKRVDGRLAHKNHLYAAIKKIHHSDDPGKETN